LFASLNIAYEEPERRNLFQFYLSAFTFTLLGILGGLVMLIAIVYVPILFASVGFSSQFETLVRLGRWPFLALFVLFLLALFYRFGPCRKNAKWRWVSVGSLFATTVWLLASAGFSFYVSHFANYDKTYGFVGSGYHLPVLVLYLLLYHSPRR
jgi:membrane protein